MRRLLTIVAIAALGLTGAACSDDDGNRARVIDVRQPESEGLLAPTPYTDLAGLTQWAQVIATVEVAGPEREELVHPHRTPFTVVDAKVIEVAKGTVSPGDTLELAYSGKALTMNAGTYLWFGSPQSLGYSVSAVYTLNRETGEATTHYNPDGRLFPDADRVTTIDAVRKLVAAPVE